MNAKHRILVAEDNAINKELIQEMLERLNYTADIVDTGTEALERYKVNQYALIFMDIQIPEMDGFEVTRKIREIENGEQHTPIVALTASIQREDKMECFDVGMDDFLSKPFEIKDLESVLNKFLG